MLVVTGVEAAGDSLLSLAEYEADWTGVHYVGDGSLDCWSVASDLSDDRRILELLTRLHVYRESLLVVARSIRASQPLLSRDRDSGLPVLDPSRVAAYAHRALGFLRRPKGYGVAKRRLQRLVLAESSLHGADWDIIAQGIEDFIRKEERIMSNYTFNGPVGVAGEHASATGFSQTQIVLGDTPFDALHLGNELAKLIQAIEGLHGPEAEQALKALRDANDAIRDSDKGRVLNALRAAGSWALGVAEKIGVPLVIAAIKLALGMP
jgi:hypothetical protein